MTDNKKYLSKLFKIQESLKEKGFVIWFDATGKILVKALNSKTAHSKILNIIKNDIDNWKNQILTEVVIEFDPDEIMNESLGGLKITIELNKVIIHGEKISIQQKNKSNSLFELRYKYNELSNFKQSDLKKLSLMISNEVFEKISPFKSYHYEDIKDFI